MNDKYIWNIYLLERADDDEPKKFIGTIDAMYGSEALTKASQYHEIPSHNLIVKRSDLDTQQK